MGSFAKPDYILVTNGVPKTRSGQCDTIDRLGSGLVRFCDLTESSGVILILGTPVGKIMRRLLRKIACQETDNLGDISTLADPTVVEKLIEQANALLK